MWTWATPQIDAVGELLVRVGRVVGLLRLDLSRAESLGGGSLGRGDVAEAAGHQREADGRQAREGCVMSSRVSSHGCFLPLLALLCKKRCKSQAFRSRPDAASCRTMAPRAAKPEEHAPALAGDGRHPVVLLSRRGPRGADQLPGHPSDHPPSFLCPVFSIATARFCAATSRWIVAAYNVPSVSDPHETFIPTASLVLSVNVATVNEEITLVAAFRPIVSESPGLQVVLDDDLHAALGVGWSHGELAGVLRGLDARRIGRHVLLDQRHRLLHRRAHLFLLVLDDLPPNPAHLLVVACGCGGNWGLLHLPVGAVVAIGLRSRFLIASDRDGRRLDPLVLPQRRRAGLQ